MITKYTYNKLCDSSRLSMEILESDIIIAEDHIETSSSGVTDVYMKDELSEGDETLLDGIIDDHVNTPLIENEAKPVSVQSAPPFESKTIIVNGVTKKLYARNVGFQQALTTGSNAINYTATYAWVKILGVEVINCEALDQVDFEVYDSPAGTYSGVPNLLLNKFAYTLNLPKDYYVRMSRFDADLYAGMVIKVTYISVSNKTVGVNLLMNEVKD